MLIGILLARNPQSAQRLPSAKDVDFEFTLADVQYDGDLPVAHFLLLAQQQSGMLLFGQFTQQFAHDPLIFLARQQLAGMGYFSTEKFV